MKHIHVIAITLIAIVFTSCEKDNKETQAPPQEDSIQFKIFNVHVQKLSDKSPMQNFRLYLAQTAWSKSGQSYKISYLSTNKTNDNGDAIFKVENGKIYDSVNYFYDITSYYHVDSTENSDYYGGIEVYHTKKTDNKLIEVQPICRVNLQCDLVNWNSLNIDSILVLNKCCLSKVMYSEEKEYYTEMGADCSKTNTIRYYYYSNGIKSKEYTKDIYIPYSSRGLDIVTCTLDFK